MIGIRGGGLIIGRGDYCNRERVLTMRSKNASKVRQIGIVFSRGKQTNLERTNCR